MTRSGNIDIGSIFDEYLQKEQQFEQEIEERYLRWNLLLVNALQLVCMYYLHERNFHFILQ